MRRILVVEDNPHDRELVLEALRRRQPDALIDLAYDGIEALDYLKCHGRFRGRLATCPDLVLLDLKTPRLDGAEVLEAVRADQHACRSPVVVLSASQEPEDLRRCYDRGANAYVVKPTGFREFVSTIGRLSAFWLTRNVPPPS